jgi:shikimate kinase
MKKNLIILTGFMGTGKTVVGERIAECLGWKCFDMDKMIEQKERMTVSEIFSKKGEGYFRKMEDKVLRDLCGQKQAVIATGGGSLLSETNRQLAEQTGIIFCLTATPKEIKRRLANYSDRPLLGPNGTKGKIIELLKVRKSIYDSFQNKIDTTEITPDQVADLILKHFRHEADC